ncbi:MAG: carboxypeptidase regulatory-like domain-containing protein, partial [Planctomycetes bacterium]|nr:carboxypeptidase regulatory-like domain-containing protein [Planctomycetota bacterium]
MKRQTIKTKLLHLLVVSTMIGTTLLQAMPALAGEGGGGQGDTGTISCNVTDNSTNPIAGAWIVITEAGNDQPIVYPAQTDASGQCQITNVPVGLRDIKAFKHQAPDDFYIRQKQQNITVSKDQTIHVSFSLEEGNYVKGTVTDNSTGQPINDASVYAYRPQTPSTHYATFPTDSSGVYAIAVPKSQDGFTVVAEASGYASANQTGVNPSTTVNFSLTATGGGGGLHHFDIANIGDQVAGQSFQITITAKAEGGSTITDYPGSCNLTASQGNINPNQATNFSNGVWTGNVTLDSQGDNIHITASDQSVSSNSNTFNVTGGGGGGLHHFDIANIGDQVAGQSFQITITAKAEGGSTITDYPGSCNLTASQGNINPNQATNFSNGVWTGNVTLDSQGDNIHITASDQSVSSNSNTFNVTGGGGGGGYFSISASRYSFMLAAGDNTTVDIDITSQGGFTGTVDLVFTGPPGLENNSSLSPSSVTLADGDTETVTLTLDVDANMPSEQYYGKVKGTSGAESSECWLDVTVGATGQPLLSVSPQHVPLDGTVTFSAMNFTPNTNINVEWKSGPFTGNVLASGTTDDNGAWSSGTVTITGQGLAGTYDIRAKTEDLEERAFTSLTVVSGVGEDYLVQVSPMRLNLAPGDNTTVEIKIQSLNSFNSQVTFSISTPNGVSCSFSPTSVTPAANGEASTTMTVTLDSWVTPGSYNIGLDCQSASINKYESVTLDVYSSMGPSVSLSQYYGSVGDVITINGYSFSSSVGQMVTLRETYSGQSLSTVPTQIMVSADGSWTGTFSIPSFFSPGGYRLEAKVDSTGESAPNVDFQLVGSGETFTVNTPNMVNVKTASGENSADVSINIDSLGAALTANVFVEKGGLWWLDYQFSGLAANQNASGADAVSVSAGGSNQINLTLTADLAAPTGSYWVDIRVESGEVSKYESIELVVTPSSGYNASISLSPATGSAGDLITINGYGFSYPSNISWMNFAGEDILAGRNISIQSNGSFSATFNVPTQMWGSNIGPGLYAVEAQDSSDTWSQSDFTVVGAGQKFYISANPDWLGSLAMDSSANTTIRVESLGAAANVTLGVDQYTLPYGVNTQFSVNPVSVPAGGFATSTLTLTVTNDAYPGMNYMVDVKGDEAGAEDWTFINFDIGSVEMDQSWMEDQGMYFPDITINPARGKAGTTVTVTGSGFPGGAVIEDLTFAGANVDIPTTTADANGDFTVLFNVPTTMWGGDIGPGWYWIDVHTRVPQDHSNEMLRGRDDWAGRDFEVAPSGTAF